MGQKGINALDNVITTQNAGNIKAKTITEAANGPTTIEADVVLERSKVFVIPDILANAGGVVVSYLEWVQNLERERWSEEEVVGKLEAKMAVAFREVYNQALKDGISMRTSALVLGVKRVSDVIKTRGIWP